MYRKYAVGFLLGLLVFSVLCSWGYSALVVAIASRSGVYPTVEQGIIARAEKYYTPDLKVNIIYAGTNSFDGSDPHIWYAIAEYRASAHADGSELHRKGCDSGGNFYLQTKRGWIMVPEGVFPVYVGKWMKILGMAGPGQATPSTNWVADSPSRHCQ